MRGANGSMGNVLDSHACRLLNETVDYYCLISFTDYNSIALSHHEGSVPAKLWRIPTPHLQRIVTVQVLIILQ